MFQNLRFTPAGKNLWALNAHAEWPSTARNQYQRFGAMFQTESVMTIERKELPAVLTTNDAAPFINRKPQTLRKWASLGIGPIRPVRIHGRLAWRIEDLRALLEGEAA